MVRKHNCRFQWNYFSFKSIHRYNFISVYYFELHKKWLHALPSSGTIKMSGKNNDRKFWNGKLPFTFLANTLYFRKESRPTRSTGKSYIVLCMRQSFFGSKNIQCFGRVELKLFSKLMFLLRVGETFILHIIFMFKKISSHKCRLLSQDHVRKNAVRTNSHKAGKYFPDITPALPLSCEKTLRCITVIL